MGSDSPPKASLYFYSKSIWSCVALLALAEKGYGPDEVDLKEVDINVGESYTPTYLRLNPKGTVPCLVVPLENSLALEIHRYKALTESKDIVEFLDKSRSVISKTHTTSAAPAPVLAPATIALSTTCNTIIDLVHSDVVSPGRFVLGARNVEELRAKAAGFPGQRVRGRYNAAKKLLDEQGETASTKCKTLWEYKVASLQPIVDLFASASKLDADLTDQEKVARSNFFADTDALWEAELRRLFATLEKEIVGPLSLGDQVSLADVHLAAYLTRLVTISGGDGTPDGIKAVGKMGGFSVGEKVAQLWATLIERESWKKLYGNGVF